MTPTSTRPASVACAICGAPVTVRPRGRPRKYCSGTCRSEADYRRHTEARQAYRAGWRARNQEKIRAANRRRDPVARAETLRRWVAANREHVNAQHRAYRRANPHLARAMAQAAYNARRARMAGPGVSTRDWRRLLARLDHRCAYCGVRRDDLAMDHVIPLSRGGRHSIGNVLPACPPCNRSKWNRLLVEWRRAA